MVVVHYGEQTTSASWCEYMSMLHQQNGTRACTTKTTAADASRASPAPGVVRVAASGRRDGRHTTRRWVAAARSGRRVAAAGTRRWVARRWVAAARPGRPPRHWWVARTVDATALGERRPPWGRHIGVDLVEISVGAPQSVPALEALGVSVSKFFNESALARGVGMISAHRAETQNTVHVPTAGAVRLDDAHGCGLCNECLIS